MKQQLLDRIYNFFVDSPDFNGISLWELSDEFGKTASEIIDTLKELVSEEQIIIQASVNPHIITFKPPDIYIQLRLLEEAKNVKVRIEKIGDITIRMPGTDHPICLYPSHELLVKQRNTDEIKDAPYTLQLALGEAQLKPIFFEIEVLERYFHDPRYKFDFDDYSGSIYHLYDKDEQPLVREEDEVFIKTFGLGFDDQQNRLAVVYLCYLNDMSKEHQVYWKSKEARFPGKVLQEYHDNTIMGSWTFSRSVFTGLTGELTALNKLCKIIFGKGIFNKDFEDEKRPKEFTFFFVPTLKNYNEFSLLLDKLISDNINKDFFKNKIDLHILEEVETGIFERKSKGTLALFEEWLISEYDLANKELITELFKPLKEIRRERQNPAHRITENAYDKSYIEKQKEVITKAYHSIRSLRKVFQQHPDAKDVQLPEWLDEGRIKVF